MAEPETGTTDISLRAAEVAADISETDRPQERRRLARAFGKAAASGARVAGRGTRAVRQRAGSGTGWLAGQVVAMAPRLRVRDQAALQAQFPGQSAEEIADALIEHAAHAAGSPLARLLRRRLAARAGRSAFSLGPLLTGAAAGAMFNSRETKRLGRD